MPRSWVTFKLGNEVLAEDIEMGSLPRQGEEVIIKDITYGVCGVQWRILPDPKIYRDVIIYLHQVKL